MTMVVYVGLPILVLSFCRKANIPSSILNIHDMQLDFLLGLWKNAHTTGGTRRHFRPLTCPAVRVHHPITYTNNQPSTSNIDTYVANGGETQPRSFSVLRRL
ncbi:hypothetical protein EDD17DRAFT_1052590 [Pisolithus thermaeus]|nr:hypothetical protein F5141DRAFT_776717 [Pisolithus sp. B1]KAI6156359.1 hypothetical protein EDD17DRAFT_1052590 [Pisolithus thermaeus]